MATTVDALLPNLPLDFYVRQADQIVTGRVEALGAEAEIVVNEVLLGEPASTVRLPVHGLHGREEDEPSYARGQEALFFLRRAKQSTQIDCVQGMAGKVDMEHGRVRSPFFPEYESANFVDLVRAFVAVRKEPVRVEKLRRLMELLASTDVFVITAASDYLNFLVHGQDSEDWVINPKESEPWDYEKYYARNALAHKKAWQKWWREQH